MQVLVCCAATALDENERLYRERLGTVHPHGYNESDSASSSLGGADRTKQRDESATGISNLYGSRGGRGGLGNGGAGGYGAGGKGGAGEETSRTDVPTCNATPKQGKEFLDAAMGGRLDDMSSMLAADPTIIHFRGLGLGQTALHWACGKGHAVAVKWLLEKGAQIEVRAWAIV